MVGAAEVLVIAVVGGGGKTTGTRTSSTLFRGGWVSCCAHVKKRAIHPPDPLLKDKGVNVRVADVDRDAELLDDHNLGLDVLALIAGEHKVSAVLLAIVLPDRKRADRVHAGRKDADRLSGDGSDGLGDRHGLHVLLEVAAVVLLGRLGLGSGRLGGAERDRDHLEPL